MTTRVLVLGGGPDAEREVSLESSRCVTEALERSGRFAVQRQIIDRLTADELAVLPGDVVFPVLHGPFGEGGPLQDMLEAGGRPYVGCGPLSARRAMDKMGTKLAAESLGVPTQPACVFNANDPACPLPLPVVVKPIHEGSSVGVHICKDITAWEAALHAVKAETAANPGRVYMVERAVLGGRELTVSILDREALAPIEIVPKAEFYDYAAKYTRDDTTYKPDPDLPKGVADTLRKRARVMAMGLGVRHLCRVDFLLDARAQPWLLEVNTMPGFTTHSLLPMAAAHAGIDFPNLTAKLVDMAVRDHERRTTQGSTDGTRI